jgi:hypothetical protein
VNGMQGTGPKLNELQELKHQHGKAQSWRDLGKQAGEFGRGQEATGLCQPVNCF